MRKKILFLCILLSYATTLSAHDSSPGVTACIEAFREQKLVFLCLQNASTACNEEALVGVREFQASQYRPCEIIIIDPADPEEQDHIKSLALNEVEHQAVTILIAPPGRKVAVFRGPTEIEQFQWVLRCPCGCSGCSCGCD